MCIHVLTDIVVGITSFLMCIPDAQADTHPAISHTAPLPVMIVVWH